jgi:hypothetical protein
MSYFPPPVLRKGSDLKRCPKMCCSWQSNVNLLRVPAKFNDEASPTRWERRLAVRFGFRVANIRITLQLLRKILSKLDNATADYERRLDSQRETWDAV